MVPGAPGAAPGARGTEQAVNVLFAFDGDLNPYVDVVRAGLAAAGRPTDAGTDKFWSDALFRHDVVHVQWPETLFGWRAPTADEMARLRRRLREIQPRARIVLTRHNAVSHLATAKNAAIFRELYELVESACDAMIHMGETSRAQCAGQPHLRGKRHVTIPLPVFDELYAPYLNVSRAEARRRLGLPTHRKIVLAFGNFRNDGEKKLVESTWRALGDPQAFLVAARWHSPRTYGFSPRHPLCLLRSMREAVRARWRHMRLEPTRDCTGEEVALGVAAADAVFIQRLDDLNSGNLPMAFLFRKAVAGPAGGNIGAWLRKTDNPVFDPQDPDSCRLALQRALELAAAGKGEENHAYAMAHWSTKQVGAAHARLYDELVAAQ